MSYAIYLRKSRADAEAEARGEGETFARHERALKELARRLDYPIARIYREIVSGESIENRPQMRQLLADVSARLYTGVLVMEVERLARGDTADQATVASTFRFSDTLIITPVKTYDPANPIDEEYFEFSLFMSRREYKTIVRRMQTGRRLAAKEGKYIASRAPFGYDRIRRPDGAWTLAPNPLEAPVVRDIFSWYSSGIGSYRIAHRLNDMGISTKLGKRWSDDGIIRTIHNPVYAGFITWDKSLKTLTSLEGGQKQYRRIPNEHSTLVRGLHEAIVPQELFDAANRATASCALPVRSDRRITNPLAGLVYCGLCGHPLMRTPGRVAPSGAHYPARISCRTPGCPNIGCSVETAETIILDTLAEWSVTYGAAPQPSARDDSRLVAIQAAEQRLSQLQQQRNRLCDFLERGIYDEDTYFRRSEALAAQIAAAQSALEAAKAQSAQPDREQLIRAVAPLCASTAAAYRAASAPEDKNRILRTVISRAVYQKDKRGNNRNDCRDQIRVDVFPAYFV